MPKLTKKLAHLVPKVSQRAEQAATIVDWGSAVFRSVRLKSECARAKDWVTKILWPPRVVGAGKG